jgi:hypothetical protein
VKSVDVEDAKKMAGVVTLEVLAPAGSEMKVAFSEVVIVAAESEEVAREAVRRVKVEYEVLEPSVVDDDLERASKYAKPGKANTQGDVDAAFKAAKAISDTEVGPSSPTAWSRCPTVEVAGGVVLDAGDLRQVATSRRRPARRRLEAHAICQHMGGGSAASSASTRGRGRPGCRRGLSGR